jgi:hypothetical protein
MPSRYYDGTTMIHHHRSPSASPSVMRNEKMISVSVVAGDGDCGGKDGYVLTPDRRKRIRRQADERLCLTARGDLTQFRRQADEDSLLSRRFNFIFHRP